MKKVKLEDGMKLYHEKRSESASNKRWIYNILTSEQKLVDLEEVDNYLNSGWEKMIEKMYGVQ